LSGSETHRREVPAARPGRSHGRIGAGDQNHGGRDVAPPGIHATILRFRMTVNLHKFDIPGHAITGVITALALFAALIIANRPWLTMDYVPYSDQAADILLVERSGLLLTGHSMGFGQIAGAMHPGPFFLYFRLLGQWLAGPLTGSVFGAHLVGVLLCSAIFAGLLAALLYDLARREGAASWTAVAGVVVALVLALAQFSAHGTLSDIWMPYVIVLPFLVFLVAAMLTMQGSSFGLLALTITTAALVHGYVLMLPIAGPVWLISAALGWRAHDGETRCGFPVPILAGTAGIIAVFMAPLLLDMAINPPGNLIRILETAVLLHNDDQTPSLHAIASILHGQWAMVQTGLWLAAAAGFTICLTTRRYGALLATGFIAGATVTAMTVLSFAASPSELGVWSAYYFVAVALLPIVMGGLLTTMELGRYWKKIPAFAAIAAIGLFSVKGTLAHPYRNHFEIREMSRLITAEFPPGSGVEIELAKIERPAAEKSLRGDVFGLEPVAGLLVDLDHFHIHACYRDPTFGWYLTPERVCSPIAPAKIAVYRLEFIPRATTQAHRWELQRIADPG